MRHAIESTIWAAVVLLGGACGGATRLDVVDDTPAGPLGGEVANPPGTIALPPNSTGGGGVTSSAGGASPSGTLALGAAGADPNSPPAWVYGHHFPPCISASDFCNCPTCEDLGADDWTSTCEAVTDCYLERCSIVGPGSEGALACDDETCDRLLEGRLESFPDDTQLAADNAFYIVFRSTFGACLWPE